ncbi:MAG: hypothetical protein RML99_09930 [Anaerolineae bacterium]|nr:hypothetical protein [Anaerolineae bacterium]
MPKVDFSPARDGFQFANYFVNQIADIPGIGKLQTAGRCGGMSYCVLDHYFARRPLPNFKPSDFGDAGVPPDGHPLADYIYQRQLDSFFTLSAVKFVTWTLAPDVGNFIVRGVTDRTKKEEFKKLREAIDRGVPVPLGLIVARTLNDLGRNHQVVGYGYDYDSQTQRMTVYIYDVNWPGQEITLTSGKDDPGWLASGPGKEQWRGWFVQDYAPRLPPPDLARPPAKPAPKTIALTERTARPRGRRSHLIVTLNRLVFFNPEAPDASAEIALEFRIADQKVRWPVRGLRAVKHGTKVKLGRRVEVDVAHDDVLEISGRVAGDVMWSQADGFDTFDWLDLDRDAAAGFFRQRFTRADKWGRGAHSVRSEGEPCGYILEYAIE